MIKAFTWAKQNVLASRLIIIFLIYPVLNLMGWFLGDILALNGVNISESLGYPLSFFLLLLFLIYPFRSDRAHRHYLVWRKSVDALMILTTFCFIVMRGNNFNRDASDSIFVTSASATATKTIDTKPSKIEKQKKKNIIKKLVRSFRNYFQSKKKDDKTGLIILFVFLALLATVGLFVLSCNIACSGAEALGYVIFFLGLGGIIFGLVRAIQRLKKGPRKSRSNLPETKTS